MELILALAFIYVPFLARVFGHYPLPPVLWIGLSLYALIIYTLDWLRKSLLRRREQVKQSRVMDTDTQGKKVEDEDARN